MYYMQIMYFLKGKATKYIDINNIPNNEYVTCKLFYRKLNKIRKVRQLWSQSYYFYFCYGIRSNQ